MTQRKPARWGGTHGAVYVEFIIAFLPFLVFFLCLWQVSVLYYTKLMVDHAAFAGARAAAVIVAESSNRVDRAGGPASVNTATDPRMRLVRTAVELALAPLIMDGTIFSLNVAYPTPGQPRSKDAMQHQKYPAMAAGSVSLMRVRVETKMACRIAFANAIMCPARSLLQLGLQLGAKVFVLPVASEGVFPYQGASYTYDPNDK